MTEVNARTEHRYDGADCDVIARTCTFVSIKRRSDSKYKLELWFADRLIANSDWHSNTVDARGEVEDELRRHSVSESPIHCLLVHPSIDGLFIVS